MPTFAVANGMSFPKLPPVLTGMTELEERLVASRIPFMQLRLGNVEGSGK